MDLFSRWMARSGSGVSPLSLIDVIELSIYLNSSCDDDDRWKPGKSGRCPQLPPVLFNESVWL